MQCDVVRLKLAVRVCQNAADVRYQLGGATIVRSEEEPLLVVIVRMDVVPDERRTPENTRHLLDRPDADPLRDDLRPRPHDVDAVQELGADGRQVLGLRDGRHGARRTVLRRTEEELRWLMEVLVDLIGNGDLRRSKRLVEALVGLTHVRLDVVEEQRKRPAAEAGDLLELALEAGDLLGVRVGHVQAGRECIDEGHSAFLSCLD